jgi:hypothetical protein
MGLLGSMGPRLIFGALGLLAAIYFAFRGDWAAVAVVTLVTVYIGGQGVVELVLWKGVKTPYDEWRLEGYGFAFAGVVFLLLAIGLFTGLIHDRESVLYGFIALGGAASAGWVVIRVFRYPPAKYEPYMRSDRDRDD